MPEVVLTPSISVIRPGSTTSSTITNPFYNFRIQSLSTTTVRSNSATSILTSTFPGRKVSTNNLFSDNLYDELSSDLESIHNDIHDDVGGDMGQIEYAAFDPIFWLHHSNVDRLLAMYQATHPGVYITPAQGSPTFADPNPGIEGLATPLYPFRHPNGEEWTSDDVKTAESIFTYGYAYPEVPVGKSASDLKTFATEKANELYGPNLASESFQGPESGAQGRCFHFSSTCSGINSLTAQQHQPLAENGAPMCSSTDKKSPAPSVSSSTLATTTRTIRLRATTRTTTSQASQQSSLGPLP